MNEPWLTAKSFEFPCGYGPRAIRLSIDRTWLFVGCKDGSVTKINLAAASKGFPGAASAVCGPAKGGIASLCDLGNGWLLLGRDTGGLALLPWMEEKPATPVDLESPLSRTARVGYVGRWGERLSDQHGAVSPPVFVASARHVDAERFWLESPPGEVPASKCRLIPGDPLPGVRSLSGFFRIGDDDRWLIGKSGALWSYREGVIRRHDDLWSSQGLERPGFVHDLVVLRRDTDTAQLDVGAYLATDEGVFLLRLHRKGEEGPLIIDPVHLPGITGMCLALAHAVQGPYCFLWVSDVDGSVHLFLSDAKRLGERPVWSRSGLREGRFPVMRAVASWTPGEYVIGQACRNDRVVVSSYWDKQATGHNVFDDAAEVLSWGTVDAIREPIGDRDWPALTDRDEGWESWTVEALVADWIEGTGALPEELRRFLRNPGIGLACSALDEILASSPEPADERAGRALTLWTHALVGTVHRRLPDRSTQDYLGIIRWLRRISERYDTGDDSHRALQERTQEAIQLTRKWGVFGGSFAARQSALSALVPLALQDTRERRFDRLVYESLVFRRRLDVELVAPDPAPQDHSLTPWSLQSLRVPGEDGEREFVAVSWQDSGTVGRLRRGAAKGPAASSADQAGWGRLEGSTGPQPQSADQYGGRILLGTCGDADHPLPYILSAPKPEGGTETIELRLLDDDPGVDTVPTLAGSLEIVALRGDPKQRHVYGFLGLDDGIVVVGLRGTGGRPSIAVIRVGQKGALEVLQPTGEEPFAAGYPELKTQEGNPVRSLARLHVGPRNDIVLLGCSDGQILKVELQVHADCSYELTSPWLVGRLGAPVRALACRSAHDGAWLRVFAGGGDGTLVAFQSLSPTKGSTPASAGNERWETLWATREQGPISGLHTFRSQTASERHKPTAAEGPAAEPSTSAKVCGPDDDSLLLALTQEGIAVLFSDRSTVERRYGDEATLRRISVPGERLGRFSLGDSVRGSSLLANEVWEPGDPHPAVARVAVVTAAGTLRVITLHHPKFTADRYQRFKDLREEWLALLSNDEGVVQGHLLRRPETTSVVAPHLPAVLVRWILPYQAGSRPWEERCGIGKAGGWPPRQWLPRHLRPLVALDDAWSRNDKNLGGKLRQALQAARDVDDRALFKEIVEATLSRANHQLFAEATGGGSQDFGPRFADLLDDVDKSSSAWIGAPGNLDSKMRITIAKSLLDGDTLWSLSQFDAQHPRSDVDHDSLGAAMPKRIELVHRFLGRGDLLLALETLRAANIALLRLCRRLERGGHERWDDDRANNQLRWRGILAFFRAVGDFAARVAHPKGMLGEVAAHEIFRAYALGMLACPPAVATLAIWMAEADLPPGSGEHVEGQLELLGVLTGMHLSPQHLAMARTALGTGQRAEGYRSALFYRALEWTTNGEGAAAPPPAGQDDTHHTPWWVEDEAAIGKPSRRIIADRRSFDRIILWLHELARQLTDNAGHVRLDRAEWLHRDLARVSPQFRHSRDFWREALADLDARMRDFADLEETSQERVATDDGLRPREVRPELVLFSPALGRWCNDQRAEIHRQRDRYAMFEPVATLYDDALGLVERAANRFRHGAAVQKNIVLGVLGHGLLELLDEHLLEMWEVAQALDPQRTWDHDSGDVGGDLAAAGSGFNPPISTAGRFADYLLRRAVNAEAIPKNLRSLQGLLSFAGAGDDAAPRSSAIRVPEATADAGEATRQRTLGTLVQEFVTKEDWRYPDDAHGRDLKGVALNAREYYFLHLTLSELAQNDRCHGVRGQPACADHGEPRLTWLPIVEPISEREVSFAFRYPRAEHQQLRERADTAFRQLQRMVPARKDPRFASHGSGLYLANLAAGAAGWKLRVEPLDKPGVLRFTLLDKRPPKGAQS